MTRQDWADAAVFAVCAAVALGCCGLMWIAQHPLDEPGPAPIAASAEEARHGDR
ncbi:hypothetical protein [Adlercreutzia faecimuris]|uniref:Lipoprotein n=1 Tax=Adlercreutzia faecimuris TaxID=2897341 RepID=A0ABS9WFA6_9ACTN|nr:hypothetical protein [Adlercreutzia sp. JBNU-10]MCI2241533.1 hypothetical protein [Adlercreutzia sp. JBNU-10]